MTNQTYKPYKPQYKELGITPVAYTPRQVPPQPQTKQASPMTMAFASKRRETQSVVPPTPNVPYAEPGLPANQLLNIGNNIENSWSSASHITPNSFSTVEDNAPIDHNHPMIDNNFEVFANQPLQMRPPLRVEEVSEPISHMEVSTTQITPAVGEYVLLVGSDVMAIGDTQTIQEAAWALLTESETLPDDIVVLKRININIGVSLSE